MIEFIICDDIKEVREKVINVVSKVMMKNKQSYKVDTFDDYNEKFMKILNKKALRIYILDIVTPSGSGIDIARVIRKKDMESIIIFITGHEELGNIILKKELYFLSFINKYEEFEERLTNSINKSLDILNIKKVLKFEDKGVVFIITLNNILFITKESNERKSTIKTDTTEYKTNKTLAQLKELLDDRFVQTHRACIVNTSRISTFNKQKRVIQFDNNCKIDLVSPKGRRELHGHIAK